jgi:hypothetical protein
MKTTLCYIVQNSPTRIPERGPDNVLSYRHRKRTNNRHSRHRQPHRADLSGTHRAPRRSLHQLIRALESRTRIPTPSDRTRNVPQELRRQHDRRLADLELRCQRCSVKLEQVKLGTVVDVHEDSPLLVEFRKVVVFDKVGDSCTGVFDLLVAITEASHDDGAIEEEIVGAVCPVDNASDAVGFAACWTEGKQGEESVR